MIIAFDLDGVVYDTEKYFLTYAELFDIKNNLGGITNRNELRITKRYAWTNEQREQYIKECVVLADEQAPLLPYAKQVLDMLKEQGHTVLAISKRGCQDPNEIPASDKRIMQDKLPFDKVIYMTGRKSDYCKQEKVELFIDDLYDNIIDVANVNIPCLYFRDLVDKKLEMQDVTEVNNWGDIYREICNINKR